MGLNAEMPGDQASDDAMSVCFDAAPLLVPLELMGAARVVLRLSSDTPLGFVVARLCDVGPEGTSVRIAHGMLNLCHRDSSATPSPMAPGAVAEVAFDLDQMAYRLASGHRLRLALSNSYWPFVWPSPEVGRLTLVGGRLHLPVSTSPPPPPPPLSAEEDGGGPAAVWSPPAAECASPWKHKVLRAGQNSRKIETDLITSLVSLVIHDDAGDVEDLAHGLQTGQTTSELWQVHPDDPLSARAVHTWEQRLARKEWRVRTEVWAEMTATASHLHMKARLRAFEGDALVFENSFHDEVVRQFV